MHCFRALVAIILAFGALLVHSGTPQMRWPHLYYSDYIAPIVPVEHQRQIDHEQCYLASKDILQDVSKLKTMLDTLADREASYVNLHDYVHW